MMQSTRRGPSPEDPELTADEYFIRGRDRAWNDIEGKLFDYTAAAQLDPDHYDAIYQRGSLLLWKHDFHDALADFNEAIRIKPKEADGYSMRGYCRVWLGDHQAALEDLSQALRLNPKHAYAFQARGAANANL